MTRRTLVSALIAFAALGAASSTHLVAAGAAATPGAARSDEDTRVTVLVVNEVTGAPLGGWDILIGPRGPHDFWYTGTTGNTGTARFLLPPGEYRAWATRGGPQVWGASFSVSDDHTRVVVAVNPYEN